MDLFIDFISIKVTSGIVFHFFFFFLFHKKTFVYGKLRPLPLWPVCLTPFNNNIKYRNNYNTLLNIKLALGRVYVPPLGINWLLLPAFFLRFTYAWNPLPNFWHWRESNLTLTESTWNWMKTKNYWVHTTLEST